VGTRNLEGDPDRSTYCQHDWGTRFPLGFHLLHKKLQKSSFGPTWGGLPQSERSEEPGAQSLTGGNKKRKGLTKLPLVFLFSTGTKGRDDTKERRKAPEKTKNRRRGGISQTGAGVKDRRKGGKENDLPHGRKGGATGGSLTKVTTM